MESEPTAKYFLKRIQEIAENYYEADDPEACLTDILTDARHFADFHGLDFANCDRMAYSHYIEERNE